jgi:gluconolactonase
MSTRRRLGLVLVALPLAFYAYACSSDSGGGGTTGEDAGGGTEGGPGIDSSTPGTDSSTPDMDSSMGTDAADASDGALPNACIGNPLTVDGGTLDGGVTLDAAVTTQIVTVPPGIFLDGPQWLDTNGGFLVYSEFDPTSRIQRVAADGGALGLFRNTGFNNATNGPVGSALRGGLLITAVDQKTGAAAAGNFFVTAPDGGAVATLSLDAGSTSPNDLVVGPGNNLYFTDGQYVGGAPGTTGLYQMYPDAAVTKIQQNFGRANGIVLAPDNTKLYVGIGPISNLEADPKAVLVYTVNPSTGTVTGPGASFLTAADLVDVPDGIAVDVGGNLWIAEAAANNVASGRIEIFSPTKKKLGTIPFPGQRPTNVAFGGPDGTKLFITTEASTSGGASAGVFTYVSRCAGIK